MSSSVEAWPPPNDPHAFESLCLDLWRCIWRDPNAQLNGRNGQPQAGVDVFGQSHGLQKGIQCKQSDGRLAKAFTSKHVDDAVANAELFEPKLKEFILATTRPRDAAIQAHARNLTFERRKADKFPVHVWAWDDIWQAIYQTEGLLESLAPKYWPALAESASEVMVLRDSERRMTLRHDFASVFVDKISELESDEVEGPDLETVRSYCASTSSYTPDFQSCAGCLLYTSPSPRD